MMNPWLVFWAPQLHLPFSGSVAQRIEPNTNWFFDAIPPTAGDSQVEKKAFEVASYGRQLGLITEVLIDIAKKIPPGTDDGRESLQRLKDIQAEIERLKEQDAAALARDVEAKVERLKKKHKAQYPQLKQKIQRALTDGKA